LLERRLVRQPSSWKRTPRGQDTEQRAKRAIERQNQWTDTDEHVDRPTAMNLSAYANTAERQSVLVGAVVMCRRGIRHGTGGGRVAVQNLQLALHAGLVMTWYQASHLQGRRFGEPDH
jgi:hypothetical protein